MLSFLVIQRGIMSGAQLVAKKQSKPLALISLILLLALIAAGEARAAAPRPLRIAFLFTSGTMASLWMAKETGAFAREGLEVEMISMASTPSAAGADRQ